MANTKAGSVIKVDTTAGFAGPIHVVSVKYMGSATGTAIITKGTTAGGNNLWEQDGTADVIDSDVSFYSPTGIYVTVTNSAVVYIYTR